MNKFLDSFNLEKRVLVCIMEQEEATIDLNEQHSHKHTVIYTNRLHDLRLKELQQATSSDIGKTIVPDDESSRR